MSPKGLALRARMEEATRGECRYILQEAMLLPIEEQLEIMRAYFRRFL